VVPVPVTVHEAPSKHGLGEQALLSLIQIKRKRIIENILK